MKLGRVCTVMAFVADPTAAASRRNVPYFEVARLDEVRDALLMARCVAHRGPLKLAAGRRICHLRDPFGTLWGLEETPIERIWALAHVVPSSSRLPCARRGWCLT